MVLCEVYKSVDGRYYNRLRRFGQGQVIFNGTEGYINRQDAEFDLSETIEALRKGSFQISSLKE